MSFRISNILDYDTFVAVDIWSFKIKVLLCRIEWQELKIIWSSSFRQSKKDMISWEITDIWSVSKALQKAISKACQHADSIPNDCILLLNTSEFVYDTTWINYIRKNKDTPISMKEIDDMIEDVELRSLDKAKMKSETRIWIGESEMQLITTSITWVYVDGQRISNPISFTWKNVKFNLINVFCPSSRYNIIKNILRDLWKNLISVVPTPIALPKLVEWTPYDFDSNVFVDIWYNKTTVVLQSNSEIIWFNVLNFWYAILEDELRMALDKSYLDIENILSDFDDNYEQYKEIIDWYLDFLFDWIAVAIRDIEKTFFIKNLFLSWAWVSEHMKKVISESLEKNSIWKHIHVMDKYANDEWSKQSLWNAMIPVLAAAKAWKELMSIKKDPLVRVLRYVIYKYE